MIFVEEKYQSGNTIRSEALFKNFQKQNTDPEIVKLIIYNTDWTVKETHTLTEDNRLARGRYFFDFLTEFTEERIIYEWYGEILGLPSVKRRSFRTERL
jgi:hypothetical protein